MRSQKEVLLDIIIASLKEGKYPSQIAREQKVSKQKIHYYIRKLQDKGLIKKTGYNSWEFNFDLGYVAKSVRGHAFMWKVKLPKSFDWKSILKINYKEHNNTFWIKIKDRNIQLTDKYLIIYEPESFFGTSAIETRKKAVFRLLGILGNIENALRIDLKGKQGYSFKVSRHHYSLIKNSLAIQCNKEGQKIQVSNDEGLWFLVDNSYNLDEAETVHPKTALVDNVGIQRYFNEHKETHFEVTPKFLLETIGGLTKSQQTTVNTMADYAKHIKAHTKSIVALSKAIPKLTKLLEETKKENEQLKQRRLKEFGL